MRAVVDKSGSSKTNKLRKWFRGKSCTASSAIVVDGLTSIQDKDCLPVQSQTQDESIKVLPGVGQTSDAQSVPFGTDRDPGTKPPVQVLTHELDDSRDPSKQAMSLLSNEERELLTEIIRGEKQEEEQILQDLLNAANEKSQLLSDKKWRISFGGRSIVLKDVAQNMASWVNSFKAVGDFVATLDPGHAGVVWPVIKLLMNVVTASEEQMGLLMIGVEQVTCLTTKCQVYQSLYLGAGQSSSIVYQRTAKELFENLTFLYAKMFTFLAYFLRLLDRGNAMRTFRAMSQPVQVPNLIDEVVKYEKRVSVSADSCEKLLVHKKLGKMTDNAQEMRTQLHELIGRIDNGMSRTWTRLDEDERCKILQWVSDIPHESDQYTARKGRTQETAGAGKTKLSSKVVDALMEGKVNDEPYALAYFYCDRNRADHRDPEAVLRSLVRQLCAPLDESTVDPVVEDVYNTRKRKGFSRGRLTSEECQDLLLQLARGNTELYVVIDGLDECESETRSILMDALEKLMAETAHVVKIYIASRLANDLRQRYEKGTHLEITANNNQADIERFVVDKMTHSKFCQTKLTSKVRSKILETFSQKSQGMFQWATLHIDELLRLERNADLLRFLDKLPKGLEAAYDNIYEQISNQTGSRRSVALAAFRAVMCSHRPLHPHELAIAVAQDPEEGFVLDLDIDMEYILEACQNLLVVVEGSSRKLSKLADEDPHKGFLVEEVQRGDHAFVKVTTTGSQEEKFSKTSICKFSHLSVQEYLELKHWDQRAANTFMAGICLRTLLCSQLSENNTENLPPSSPCPPSSSSVIMTTQDRLDGTEKGDDNDIDGGLLLFKVSERESPLILKISPPTDDQDDKNNMLVTQSRAVDRRAEMVLAIPEAEHGTLTASDDLAARSDTRARTGNERIEPDAFHSHSEPKIEPPITFVAYVEHITTHEHDDTESCLSQNFEPFVHDWRGSAFESWALYCAEYMPVHYELGCASAENTGQVLTVNNLLKDLMGDPFASSIHYRAWACLAQNSPVIKAKNRDSTKKTSFRSLIRPHTQSSLGCVLFGFNTVLDEWLKNGVLDLQDDKAHGRRLFFAATAVRNTGACDLLRKHGVFVDGEVFQPEKPTQQ